MPYIDQTQRDILDPIIEDLRKSLVGMELDLDDNNMEGNINYFVSKLLVIVYGNKDNTSYSSINDATGLLECIKQEYYRKVAAPYENQKEFENGEI